MAGKPHVTIADVAREAGVSTATAGRVLGNYGYTGEATRDRVTRAARKLGYRPNALARSLITGKTRTLGVVAGDIQNPFYAAVLRGISNVAGREGFGLLITNSDEDLRAEIRAVDLLLEKQVDGLIVSPCDTGEARHLRALAQSGLPLVLIDRAVAGLPVDRVAAENIGASREAVSRLIAAGHRRIALVGELSAPPEAGLEGFIAAAAQGLPPGSEGLYPSWQRLTGYLQAHRLAGLVPDPALIRRAGDYAPEAARRQAHALLTESDRATAIFTTDGTMTEGVMQAVTELGLTIPRDLSVIGFDDLDWMGFLPPGIAAVAQPRRAIGEAAARMLLERIAGETPPARALTLAGEIRPRGSIAAPRG